MANSVIVAARSIIGLFNRVRHRVLRSDLPRCERRDGMRPLSIGSHHSGRTDGLGDGIGGPNAMIKGTSPNALRTHQRTQTEEVSGAIRKGQRRFSLTRQALLSRHDSGARDQLGSISADDRRLGPSYLFLELRYSIGGIDHGRQCLL